MESILQPPKPFEFENSLCNITSGNLSTEWQKWKSAFNIYYEACELANKSKKTQINILLHVIGEKCREVAAQFNGEFNTINELLAKFDGFFIPKKNLAVERHRFFKRDQKELESTEQYVFELNKMAVKCEFKDLRDDLVCSRLICGVRDMALSERLLREPEIKLEKALDICRLAEMSRMQAKDMKVENQEYKNNVQEISTTNEYEINWMQRKGKPRQVSRWPQESAASRSRSHYQPKYDTTTPHRYSVEKSAPVAVQSQSTDTVKHIVQRYQHINKRCGRCGRVHRRNECPAFGQRCIKCERMNHYARMCRVYAVHEDSTDQILYGGPIMHYDCRDMLLKTTESPEGQQWSDDYHVYAVRWEPENITLLVDDKVWATIEPSPEGLQEKLPEQCTHLPRAYLKKGGKMAPFDNYFHISLGLSAGGNTEFPDGVETGGSKPKPWINDGKTALLAFWSERENWLPTWTAPQLLIDYVKVVAL